MRILNIHNFIESQSPQAGQFNSYEYMDIMPDDAIHCLNPLKRVNSILT